MFFGLEFVVGCLCILFMGLGHVVFGVRACCWVLVHIVFKVCVYCFGVWCIWLLGLVCIVLGVGAYCF